MEYSLKWVQWNSCHCWACLLDPFLFAFCIFTSSWRCLMQYNWNNFIVSSHPFYCFSGRKYWSIWQVNMTLVVIRTPLSHWVLKWLVIFLHLHPEYNWSMKKGGENSFPPKTFTERDNSKFYKLMGCWLFLQQFWTTWEQYLMLSHRAPLMPSDFSFSSSHRAGSLKTEWLHSCFNSSFSIDHFL